MEGLAGSSLLRPGNRVYFVASSKAMMDATGEAPLRLISPAHIRELVGSWVIQRSSVGAWAGIGLQMLTPLQLVLVTTYRLSDESQQDCHRLGVQVWGLAELTYLICRYAPPAVFSGPNGAFSTAEFNVWWKDKDRGRLARPSGLTALLQARITVRLIIYDRSAMPHRERGLPLQRSLGSSCETVPVGWDSG